MPRARSLRSLTIASNAKRNASPGPPSPTYSDTSHASAMNFGPNGPAKIITRAHLKASLHAYEEVRHSTFCSLSFLLTPLFDMQLMTTSANYRKALLSISKATAAFADAMEQCSGYVFNVCAAEYSSAHTMVRLKGPGYEAGTRLQAASGLHHLIGNQWHILVRNANLTCLHSVDHSTIGRDP
jgi:hypothetical protein